MVRFTRLNHTLFSRKKERSFAMNSAQEVATQITIAWLNAFAIITKELGHVEQHIPTPKEVSEFFAEIHRTAQKTNT